MNTNNKDRREIHHNIKHCDSVTILELYGISIEADGTVLDNSDASKHASVDTWIDSSYTEDYEDFEKFSKYDDYFD